MSEWVDFGLYALQATLLWMVLPAWGARFLRPASASGSGAPRGGAWVRVVQAWGAISLVLLLACRLGRFPPAAADTAPRPAWETLLLASNVLLAIGALVAASGLWRFLRWLRTSETTAQGVAARVFPFTRDDFLPCWLQYLAGALVLLALLARPAAALVWPDRVHDVLGNFITGLVLAMLLFFAAGGSMMRAPHRLDQALGERYRQMEVGICYLLMTCLALLEIAGLLLELSDLRSRRHVALLLAGFMSVTLGSLMLLSLRPVRRDPVAADFELPP
jgi:hypothetical protein